MQRLVLDGLPGGRGINIAYEAVDRHAAGSRSAATALRCIAKDGSVTALTYADLRGQTSRFANLLRELGVSKGDLVFSLLGRVPELYVAALGTLKNASVFSPLFPAFGPEPIRERLRLGDAKVLVTSPELYQRRIVPIRDTLPGLEHVLIVGHPPDDKTTELASALAAADDQFDIPATDPEDMALLHFTSGTTGKPKGAVHVHQAVVAHQATAAFALDLRPQDIFWCTADPGWVTGTSYGIIAPLTLGLTLVTDAADFEARRWYQLLADHKVTVWYTAPTAIRMLMRYGSDLPAAHDLSALRFIASVGEPLNPDAVVWGQQTPGPAHSRQLVANGNRRHHDQQLRVHGHQARVHGSAAPGRDRRAAGARGRWAGAGDRREGHRDHRGRYRGRARPAAWLAIDVPRLPARRRALRRGVRGRLVSHRRRGASRCRRLLLVRRARRRRDQIRWPPHRPVRGRERAEGAPGWKTTGCSRGRGGSMHLFDVPRRFYGGNAIVGGGLPLAIGIALADRMRGEERVTACFFGDGAVAEGEFHECMSLAALWDLPLLFCCENNLYAMGTALERAQAQTDLALRAGTYGMAAWPVDGMDVIAVEHAARKAAEAVRAGGGPHFLELRTYRFRAHSMYDPELYWDKAEVEQWRRRDPIDMLVGRMREAGELHDDELAAMEDTLVGEIDASVAAARAAPAEPVEDLTKFVYSPESS